jgi:hypothetical protein
MNPASNKETVYVDIDDEITGIIDKVQSSNGKIVALVLPKRAAMLHSVVNMKLLKRTAANAKKQVVLITSEHNILPLAGAVGLYVASTLQSKPAIPPSPLDSDGTAAVGPETDLVDPTKPVGELAGLAAANQAKDEEAIEIDSAPEAEAVPASTKKSKKPGAGKNKLKVPNFEKFRTKIALGALGLLLLIGGWYLAFFVMPRASVTLTTDTSETSVDLQLTASPAATRIDAENRIVPVVTREVQRTQSERNSASGQRNLGEKASGTVGLQNCTKTDGAVRIPAGTTITSNNLAFVTQENVNLPESSFSGSDRCTTDSKDVRVVAQSAGDQYNLASGRSFSVGGYGNVRGSNSSAFSGGTNRIVKIVEQADIDAARDRALEAAEEDVQDEVADQLKADEYIPFVDTYKVSGPVVNSNVNAGGEANEVTVNVVVTYTMMGFKEDDLNQIIEDYAKEQIDTDKMMVVDTGLNEATFKIGDRRDNGDVLFNLQTVVAAGPKLEADDLRREIAGKKRGEAVNLLESYPGVQKAEVNYSPFWVYSTPKSVDKIKINFEQANDSGR